MEFKLEEEIKNITQKMKHNHSDLMKTVEDIEHRFDEVNEQMDSFSVDMSSASETIKDTLEIVIEKIHRFSNETEISRNETERLDVSSSKFNKTMKSNEKKISEVNRLLHSYSKNK